ncbi:HAD family hydrolase [Yoonia sediminilitoris]|uniref:2-haloacid dehalogenase n=1 Tax=Yoonia sediminilitoris TaxID=1286148 RepID=A0A2T6KIM2_9RHOB|nr:HAD family phosphatase [Yoonia sediminilitoris]PUB15576.1 2-haloacid dehalogenase [Yoonia sediminilitoris]RCW96185.1 2-haloacid dehalogenase [Yoonia sediminilitoris]
MSDINAVIFDIGNVLIEWQPERFYDRVIGADRRKAMFAAIDLHGINDQVDRGHGFRETIHAAADAHPDWRDEVLMWHDNWLDMATPTIDHSVRLLRGLRAADMPVFALSNFGIQPFAIAEPVYPFLGEFDRRYISGHMGEVKPEPRIYEMVEQDCGLAPETLLFVDDRRENLDTAATRGWQTHLFDGPQGWADRLVREGLLSPEAAQ